MRRRMADWATISSLATAGGTLVLAVATFSSVRSANRAARVAEKSLLVGARPLLITSREDDPPMRVGFARQQRDLYIPPGHLGFWQGALRDPADRDYPPLAAAAAQGERIAVDLLYGDQFGGQRTVMRIGISDWEEVEGKRAEIGRYWNVDGHDPR